jgi:phosphoglycerol transferase
VVEPQFRALNRISVVIAFFAIAALLLLVQRAAQAVPARLRQGALATVATVLLLIGLWDQVPAHPRPPSDRIDAQYASDRAFVQRIEQALPPGASVLQLPYVAFPEAPPLHKEGTYSQLRGFLHSEHLRWSHGGMRGRESDLWHRTLAQQPVPELLRLATASGFSGIWLDRRATPDQGAQLDSALRANGVRFEFQSPDGSLAWYRLPTSAAPTTSPARLPPWLGKGFYPWERNGNARWAWAAGDADLVVLQPTASVPQRVRLTVRTLVPRDVQVLIGDQVVASARLLRREPKELVFEHRFSKPVTTLRLRTDTPAQKEAADPRPLSFALMSFEMSDSNRTAPP